MIEHLEYTNEPLRNEAVNLLKALGVDKSKVLLVEVQNYTEFKRVYGQATADDYFNSKEQFIIYYHESGIIETFNLFNPEHQVDFEAAVENIANQLN
jgi:hypothetical protein